MINRLCLKLRKSWCLLLKGLTSYKFLKTANTINFCLIFGRPLVKRLVLCYGTVVLSVCPVCLVCLFVCRWRWCTVVKRLDGSKMKLGWQVGLGPGHIVLDGDPAPPRKGHSPQFSAHVYCGQTAGWIKMPLGTEVRLGPGDIVLDGDPALP